jgi:hypothetical protein
MDVHIRNLTGLAGKGVTLVENPKSASKRDKEFFKSMVGILDSIDDRTNSLMEMGIDIVKYEDPFFQIIEGLIIKSYGHLAGGLILWWCGERKLLDATAESFDRNIKEDELCIINPNFYHRLYQTTGNDAANITMLYDALQDGSYATMAHWQNISQWEDMNGSATNISGFNAAQVNNWTDFSSSPFALANAN